MRAIVSPFAAVAIAMMVCGSAAWADKPEQYPVSETVTGQWVADCGDFLVLTDYRIEGFELHYFRDDGSVSKWFIKVSYVDTVFYNANDPSYWLAGTAEGTQNFVYFDENGQLINQVRTGASFRVIVPGYGPVFLDVGRWVYDASLNEFTFLAGRHDFFEGILIGEVESDALCAALRP